MIKLSNEGKIGLLAIITIALFIWGLKFLKGQNILSASKNIFVEYKNIDQLKVSSPVLINGFEVGVVKDIYLKPEDLNTIIVVLNIKGKIIFPKNAVAMIVNAGLMGGKAVEIRYSNPCNGGDCVVSGDYLKGETEGLLQSMLGRPDQFEGYIGAFKNNARGILDSLDSSIKNPSNSIGKALNDLEVVIHHLKGTTAAMDATMNASSGNINATMKNLNSISANIAASNNQIKSLISNLDAVSLQLKNGNLDGTLKTANIAMEKANQTLNKTDLAIGELNSILNKVNKGDGTMAKLVNDGTLYTNLNGLSKDLSKVSKNLDLLLQDFRLNPKRYVNVSVFGKKQKEYALPQNDPAYLDTLKNK